MLKTKISPPKTLQIKTVPWRKNRGPGPVDLTVQLSSVLISTEIDFFEALTKNMMSILRSSISYTALSNLNPP
jgi:hypothetical protein